MILYIAKNKEVIAMEVKFKDLSDNIVEFLSQLLYEDIQDYYFNQNEFEQNNDLEKKTKLKESEKIK